MKTTPLLNLILVFALGLFQACSKKGDYFAKESLQDSITQTSCQGADCGTENPTGNPPMVLLNQIIENFAVTSEKLPVDILFVIDNSYSMNNKQQDLRNNFQTFISEFVNKDLDFKIAITSTDPDSDAANCPLASTVYNNSTKKSGSNSQIVALANNLRVQDGCVVPGSFEKLTSAKAQENQQLFIDDFKFLSYLGVNGRGAHEQGLKTTKRFLQRYPQFLRSNATLAVIVLSDEEENQNSTYPLETVSQYVNFYKSVKSNPQHVKVHSIVALSPQISIESRGDRYIQASNLTGGLVTSIHDPFAETMLDIGQSIVNLSTNYQLGQVPASGLKVFLNGSQQAMTEGYSYHAQNNTIVFNPELALGTQVRIEYLINP